MRGDISDLKQEYPDLADEFVSLRSELESPADRVTGLTADGISSWESQAKRRREAEEQFSSSLQRFALSLDSTAFFFHQRETS
ncbi:uncharacterized protein PV07_10532 [Cladophialophora immunda]|uniref:Uncharacterized protein n=1 Tax=Cladophialophora immunda TaxID=569365 RepID=A0A0D2CMQ1_9EURO|nr:uncharacterized protein PV07_10532 [Cladophialophora immunda]KIW24844.1 hypothetical protein PV07_10532 [Cladophialophora immunda]